jgi:hypothetical protein
MVEKLREDAQRALVATQATKFTGVTRDKRTGRWRAEFRSGGDGKPTFLGYYGTQEEAARAYDRMMVWLELHGHTRRGGFTLNFERGDYQSEEDELGAITTQEDMVAKLRQQATEQRQGAAGEANNNTNEAGESSASGSGERKGVRKRKAPGSSPPLRPCDGGGAGDAAETDDDDDDDDEEEEEEEEWDEEEEVMEEEEEELDEELEEELEEEEADEGEGAGAGFSGGGAAEEMGEEGGVTGVDPRVEAPAGQPPPLKQMSKAEVKTEAPEGEIAAAGGPTSAADDEVEMRTLTPSEVKREKNDARERQLGIETWGTALKHRRPPPPPAPDDGGDVSDGYSEEI